MDSRAEFDKWFEKNGAKRHGEGKEGVMKAFFSIWQAGRASMRDEAAALVAPKCKRYCDCDVCDCGNSGNLAAVIAWDSDMAAANAIKAIEP